MVSLTAENSINWLKQIPVYAIIINQQQNYILYIVVFAITGKHLPFWCFNSTIPKHIIQV